MNFITEAISQNKQWETGRMEFPRTSGPLVQRESFARLEASAKTKFITIIRGMRRVGKSVMVRQLLQKMIDRGANPKRVCWFEFDRAMGATREDLNSLIRFFLSQGADTIVLDEIHFVSHWQDILKRHYDRTDVKFIAAGSCALELDRRSAESLAGRFDMIKLLPFSFSEYLVLKGKAVPKSELEKIERASEMAAECDSYMRSTGFPEAILQGGEEREKYIRSAVIEPVFYKDIPATFPNAKPDMLLQVLELLAGTVGGTFQHQSIASVVGCSHPALSESVMILERSLLVKTLYNQTSSLLKQRRTSKKIAFADNGLLSVLNPQVATGFLAENAVWQSLQATHFFRDPQGHEVDLLLPEKKLAIEVKYQQSITPSDEKNLLYFLQRHPGWKGVLITKDGQKEGRVAHIPLWKWLLEN